MPGRVLALVAVVGLAAVVLAVVVLGRGEAEEADPAAGLARRDLVLYTIGVSTDPYGRSTPEGFGVARERNDRFRSVAEIRDEELGGSGGAEWLGERRFLVPQTPPPFRPRVVFRLDESRLVRQGTQRLPPRDTTVAVSPDRAWIASEGIEPCEPEQETLWECYRQTGKIHLQRPDGSDRRLLARGHLDGWTPDGRVLLTSLDYNEPYRALDIETGRRALPLDPELIAEFARTDGAAVLGTPRWSADGRYIAARVSARWATETTVAAIVIADATGKPLRLLRSRYVISMLAWSPTGHRLAYTTSGFPDPHELFVVDSPRARPRPVLTTERHFDWVSWAPDSRRLVLDDEVEDVWLLVPAQPPYTFVASPRLGGRPLWCCPVNAYATQ
jgi:hypothetical protein